MVTRVMWGIWVDDQSVMSPVAGFASAIAPRGSIAVGISRGR